MKQKKTSNQKGYLIKIYRMMGLLKIFVKMFALGSKLGISWTVGLGCRYKSD